MNVPFLKLRVANDAWLVVTAPDQEPDWPSFARLACSSASGAAASGAVVLGQGGQSARAYGRQGTPLPLPPSACLCAARWLFDAGRSSRDAVLISGSGEGGADIEVLTVDSRAFALNLGGVRVLKKNSAPRTAEPGKNPAVALARVEAGGQELKVRLFDGWAGMAARRACPRDEVLAACVSRERVRVYRRGSDALLAAAAACSAAAELGLMEAECAAELPGGAVLVQKPDDSSFVVVAEPEYCLSGEIWMQEGS